MLNYVLGYLKGIYSEFRKNNANLNMFHLNPEYLMALKEEIPDFIYDDKIIFLKGKEIVYVSKDGISMLPS